MCLVLAIILGAIIISQLSSEKISSEEYDMRAQKEESERKAWMDSFTDKDLEDSLKKIVKDPVRKAEVKEELAQAMSEIGDIVSWLTDDEKIDILLANRGKVSCLSEEVGYVSCSKTVKSRGRYKNVVSDSQGDKRKTAIMLWIRDTLRAHGKNVNLWRTEGWYYWEGSYAYKCHIQDMERYGISTSSGTFKKIDEWNIA